MRWFLDHSLSRIENKDFNFLNFFCRPLDASIPKVGQDFSTTYEDSMGSIFQSWETVYYIRATGEQNANFSPVPQENITLRILLMRLLSKY
jgi:hypothetical protein